MERKYGFFIVMISILFSSCLFEEKDIFDEPAAERKQAAVKEFNEILKSASNGWVFEYYPHEARTQGGWNYLVKFEEGDTVLASFEYMRQPAVKQSLYEVMYDFGAMLSFNTYNQYLHFFAEAMNTGALYQGRKGDYEFMMMDYNDADGELRLKGKRTTNYMTMTKLGNDVVWSEYLDKVNDTEAVWFLADYDIIVNGIEVGTASKSDRTITFSWTEDGETKKVSSALTYKPDGNIRLYDFVTVAGVQVRNFKYDSSSNTAACTDAGANVVLKPILSDDFVFYDQYLGDWNLRATNGTMYKVTFSQKERNKSFNMTSEFWPGLSIEWLWSSSFSGKRLTLYCQVLETTPEGNLLGLLPAYVNDTGGTSFNSSLNSTALYFTFDGNNTIPCTGSSTGSYTGFILYYRNAANSASIGWYQGGPNTFLGTSLTR